MASKSWVERLLAHDRAVVVIALTTVIATCWSYLLLGAGTGMSTWGMTSWRMALGLEEPMTTPVAWNWAYALVMVVMWWVMMIAMMLPSAAPMILLYALIDRKTATRDGSPAGVLATLIFTSGYVAAWGLFSIIATTFQWAFEGLGVLSPMMMNSTSTVFAGLILLFAGAYQLTPLKQACLEHCQGPIQFLMHNWRAGLGGAFRMGMHHGTYCLGCCWGLMAILFFGGIMNLYWIIGLAVLVLIEKTAPAGTRVSYVTGGIFAAWGLSLLVRALA